MQRRVFGAKCPVCGKVYEVYVDVDDCLMDTPEKKAGIGTIHCPLCRLHPALVWISQYRILEIVQVKVKEPLVKVVSRLPGG